MTPEERRLEALRLLDEWYSTPALPPSHEEEAFLTGLVRHLKQARASLRDVLEKMDVLIAVLEQDDRRGP